MGEKNLLCDYFFISHNHSHNTANYLLKTYHLMGIILGDLHPFSFNSYIIPKNVWIIRTTGRRGNWGSEILSSLSKFILGQFTFQSPLSLIYHTAFPAKPKWRITRWVSLHCVLTSCSKEFRVSAVRCAFCVLVQKAMSSPTIPSSFCPYRTHISATGGKIGQVKTQFISCRFLLEETIILSLLNPHLFSTY